jgi:DNA polymerase-3 subunit delta
MHLPLDKVLSHQLILISGQESSLRQQALRAILEKVSHSEGEFESFHADIKPVREWFAMASTVPFLGERRVVIVRHLLRVSESAMSQVKEISLPSTAFVVLVADEEEGDESKQKKLNALREAWKKWVTQQKGFVVSCEVNPKELRSYLTQEIGKHKKTITPAALETLIEMSGQQLSYALGELEKLVLYVGDHPQICEQDVRTVVIPRREWNIYRMIEGVLQGNSHEALRQLRILIGSESKPEETAFIKILPAFSRQFKLIWQARCCHEAGVTPSTVPGKVSEAFLGKGSILQEPEWSQSRLMKFARDISLERLGSYLEILADTDARLKGILSSFSAHETLEQMVLRMCNLGEMKKINK